MLKGALTKDNQDVNFTFLGECNICLEGDGTVEIQRDIGNGYSTLTDGQGRKMVFVSDGGVLFNSALTYNKKYNYKLVGTTETEISYTISPEDR
jgi:hypothetical protein